MKMAGSALACAGATVGEAAVSAAAATRTFTIHHPPRWTALEKQRRGTKDRLILARKIPLFIHFAHQTPQPDTGDYGHRVIKNCLAKSAIGEHLSTDRGRS